MESRTNKRKRVPDPADQEWVKPANVPKELRDCVASLASTVNTLQQSVNVLKDATADSGRLRRVVAFEKKYEVVSENEIRDARADLEATIRPKAEEILAEIRKQLKAMAQEEEELQAKVDQQAEQVEQMRQQQQQQQASTSPPPPPPPPASSATPDKRPQLTQRLEQLKLHVKNEKQRLDQLTKEAAEKEKRSHYYKTHMATKEMKEKVSSTPSSSQAPSTVSRPSMTPEVIYTLHPTSKPTQSNHDDARNHACSNGNGTNA
ncbi:hypothetical protein O0I10_012911 [Lichtheimia ornata]|uniref:DASH complex subunit SPC19 n=1 Tax=Lichtheimia ornata TaxID=688661 RepID=A0AAD7UQ61_9FUNG|nr:uncharacterized protein O0I10_012911 [Lichtheimia ornata]KAJ8651522.1 hypothetical protein O0I10_012911 [Lichtheimia ornata]